MSKPLKLKVCYKKQIKMVLTLKKNTNIFFKISVQGIINEYKHLTTLLYGAPPP